MQQHWILNGQCDILNEVLNMEFVSNGEARISTGKGCNMVGRFGSVPSSCRFGATWTDEQQAQRKERHGKHKQWYSGFDRSAKQCCQCYLDNLLFISNDKPKSIILFSRRDYDTLNINAYMKKNT